jgi:hypothetical protein
MNAFIIQSVQWLYINASWSFSWGHSWSEMSYEHESDFNGYGDVGIWDEAWLGNYSFIYWIREWTVWKKNIVQFSLVNVQNGHHQRGRTSWLTLTTESITLQRTVVSLICLTAQKTCWSSSSLLLTLFSYTMWPETTDINCVYHHGQSVSQGLSHSNTMWHS